MHHVEVFVEVFARIRVDGEGARGFGAVHWYQGRGATADDDEGGGKGEVGERRRGKDRAEGTEEFLAVLRRMGLAGLEDKDLGED